MAEESYTTRTESPGPRPRTETGMEDPAAARSEIEMTRARMSETIDELEDALIRRKERIRDRLDVTAPVRENPMPSAAAALGAGLLLGLLTGGGEGERDVRRRPDARRSRVRDERLDEAEERARTWEARARRLRRVARDQRAQLELADELDRFEWEYGPEPDGRLSDLRDRVVDGVSGFLGNFAREVLAFRR